MEELKNRIDFVYVWDVKDGNPNGDPASGDNSPRIEDDTDLGLASDSCIKRKIRNYVDTVKQGTPGYDIFIRDKVILNNIVTDIYNEDSIKNIKEAKGENEKERAATKLICQRYFDARTFGAVLTRGGGNNAGQLRGPVQITFSKSIDPIDCQKHVIDRIAVATPKEAEKQNGNNHTMGSKYIVPYGLYKCYGFISANLARQTGFNSDDLQLLWQALENMFDLDHSAGRGLMTARKLIIFKHDSEFGNIQADTLFRSVNIKKIIDGVPRDFSDYKITIDRKMIPENVECKELL